MAIPTKPGLLSRLRSGLARVAGRSASLDAGDRYGHLLGAPVLSGVSVTPQTALGLTAYYCGVNVIATDVAKLPLNLYRRKRAGGQTIVTGDPRNTLVFSRPNAFQPSMRRRQAEMGHVLGWGNAYTRIVRDANTGMPVAFQALHPGSIHPKKINGTLYYENTETRELYRAEDVLHVAGLGFDGLCGYSPVTIARQAIGLGLGVEQFGAALFGNGAIPKGLIKPSKPVSEVQARQIRDSFYGEHGGPRNAHRVGILPPGLDWVNTQINPDDAQFLATRQFQVIEIARLLNLPPHKLGDYSESHLANVEEANLDYSTSTLQGWLEAIEAECNNKLLFDDERDRLFFQHDMTALMRGNMAARGSFYKTLFSVGAITPNQIASKEGMNPSREPNADKAYLQAQYVPLDMAGQVMLAKAGRPPSGDNEPEPDDNEPAATNAKD